MLDSWLPASPSPFFSPLRETVREGGEQVASKLELPPSPSLPRKGGESRLRPVATPRLIAITLLLALIVPTPAFAAQGLDGAKLSALWALPFAGLLLCIATGPVFYPHLWEHHFGKITAAWAAWDDPAVHDRGCATATTTFAHVMLADEVPSSCCC